MKTMAISIVIPVTQLSGGGTNLSDSWKGRNGKARAIPSFARSAGEEDTVLVLFVIEGRKERPAGTAVLTGRMLPCSLERVA